MKTLLPEMGEMSTLNIKSEDEFKNLTQEKAENLGLLDVQIDVALADFIKREKLLQDSSKIFHQNKRSNRPTTLRLNTC